MKFTAPKDLGSFALDSNDPVIQQMVIDTLRINGIKVYEDTNEFDPAFPVLGWEDDMLTQWRHNNNRVTYRLEDFIRQFQSKPHIHTLQLNKDHKAVVDLKEKIVKVGCQTFNFETINKLSELIKKKI
jgi:hypothetical protein